jgi:hypothetical protein
MHIDPTKARFSEIRLPLAPSTGGPSPLLSGRAIVVSSAFPKKRKYDSLAHRLQMEMHEHAGRDFIER